MINLKRYQENTLRLLKEYLECARIRGAKQAYDEVQFQRYQSNDFKPFQALKELEDVPYACLRLPTGGGKTLLSAHTIRLAGECYIERDYPLTLWLVPTNTIKMQTLETLKNPDHPNYQVLSDTFNGRFKVFDISDFRQLRPQDIEGSACVIVSTFAALRVEHTEGRKVYAHDENLEPHFSKIPKHVDNMERDDASGNIKFSFANLLYWHQPLVIIDEAHNAKSELSLEVLKRVNATCVIEYTATPASNSNVIYCVSASELKAEEMIKLPIFLSEHVSWKLAVTASIQTRHKLEECANKDKDYIRPIILFQAENKGQEITVEVLKKHLIEDEGISRAEIAIATGDQRELDAINLFDPNCQIRYVITVQALKEGWDCSFAYVLCSVANTKSATAVEQLLGRVLRMPYAKNRIQKELNQAYAFVSSQSWPHAVSKLNDCLVNMGFEQQEADEFFYMQPTLEISDSLNVQPFEVILTQAPNTYYFTKVSQDTTIEVQELPEENLFKLTASGAINPDVIQAIESAAITKQDKQEVVLRGQKYFNKHMSTMTPSERGEKFFMPQLCLAFKDRIEVAEKELCLDESGWNLLDYYTPSTKADFEFDEEAKQYLVDLYGHKIKVNILSKPEQLSLDGIRTDMTDLDLVKWLDKKLRAFDVPQDHLLEYLRRTVEDLLSRDDLDLGKIIRSKYILEKIIQQKINNARTAAYKQGYQKCMFGAAAIACVDLDNHIFKFMSDYPANLLYEGRLSFNKHFYSRIAFMNGEEIECAKILDSHPKVKYWVRNLERKDKHAFWLPTSTDKFYPDFVALLNDGRILVIEYKGAHLDNNDTDEKKQIGEVWAQKSNNLFLMAWKIDEDGRDIQKQINNLIT